jgi:hypothetical protein
MHRKASNREGKNALEERGDAKLHLLSPRRHLPQGEGEGFPRAGEKKEAAVRGAGEKEEESAARARE